MKPITGHTSPETAYLVDDYPYGFQLRCKHRSWIETTPKHGQRICHQTTDPRRGNTTWNKPKKSTYSDLIVMGIDEETGHLTTDRISFGHSSEISLEKFLDTYAPHFDETQKKIAKAGRYILLARRHMHRLTEGKNIYDIPREDVPRIMAEAKKAALVDLASY